MSSFNVSIILRMVDQLTSPARRAQQAVRGMGQSIQQTAAAIRSGSRSMERPFIDALNRMQRKAVEIAGRIRQALSRITALPAGGMAELRGRVGAARSDLVGSLFMAAPMILPFKAASENELALARLGHLLRDPAHRHGANRPARGFAPRFGAGWLVDHGWRPAAARL